MAVHTMLRPFVLITLLITLAAPAIAQEAPLELMRLDGAITLDGRPDEAAWERIPTLPLTMYTPVFRGQPTQRTVIRVAYDDENFYAAGWFYDSENIQLASVRVRTALNARAFGNAFVQYNSTTGRVDFNVRLRYAVTEGTDLWLV